MNAWYQIRIWVVALPYASWIHVACDCIEILCIWSISCMGLRPSFECASNLMFECFQRVLSGRDLAIVGWNIIACILINTEHVFLHVFPLDPSMKLFPVLMLRFHIGIFLYICVMPVISYPGSLCGLRRIQISKSVCASLHELIWLLVGRWRSFSSFSFINHFVACGSDNLLDQQYGFGGSASILMVWYWTVQ